MAPETTWRPVGQASVAAAGMCLFALFVHEGPPLVLFSACGLLLTASVVYRSLKDDPSPAALLGLSGFSRRAAAFTVIGCILGFALGIAYLLKYSPTLLPGAIGPFAPLAAVIGGTEEIIYRGYVQGRARSLGPALAVALAALCHTAYKCALFLLPSSAADVSIWLLATATFTVGLSFGALRQLSGSVIPPLAAHACFDIFVYGGLARAPWWVWS